jgi:cytochrome P450
VIDVLLSEPHYKTHWPAIQELATDPSPNAAEKLRTYALEALRLSSPAAPFLRTSDSGEGPIVHVDVATASRDPTQFPDPDQIKLDRPLDSYLPFFDGLHGALVEEVVMAGLVAQLQVLGKLVGLKRAPGESGVLRRKSENGIVRFLSEARDAWVPFPTSKWKTSFIVECARLTVCRHESAV